MADVAAGVQSKKQPGFHTQQAAEEGILEPTTGSWASWLTGSFTPESWLSKESLLYDIGIRLRFSLDKFLPSHKDDPRVFEIKKNAVIGKVVPHSIVPISTSNSFLLVAAKFGIKDCYFRLPELMVATGAVSLSLVVFGVLSRHIIEWVLNYHRVNRGHLRLIHFLQLTGKVLSLAQTLLLAFTMAILIPELPKVDTKHKESQKYCDYHMVMYSSIYLLMNSFFVFTSIVLFFYIKLCRLYWSYTGKYKSSEEVIEIEEKVVDEGVGVIQIQGQTSELHTSPSGSPASLFSVASSRSSSSKRSRQKSREREKRVEQYKSKYLNKFEEWWRKSRRQNQGSGRKSW